MQQTTPRPETARLIVKHLVKIAVFMLILGAILFISAGRFDWGMGWVYIGFCLAAATTTALVMIPANPELIAERARVGEGAKKWDIVLAVLVKWNSVFIPVVAGLDVRYGWTRHLPLAVHLAGLAVAIAAYLLVLWSMKSNRFFSTVVRIQKDRGHTVASTGPYQFLRHPGYVGMAGFTLGAPLILGSWWAFIPTAFTICVLVVRTALEDRTLQAELMATRIMPPGCAIAFCPASGSQQALAQRCVGRAKRVRIGMEPVMGINELLKEKRGEILRIAARHGARNVRVFGSVARGEATGNSDVDLLVDFEAGRNLLDHVALVQDLEDLLGGKVQVVTEKALHWYIHDRVMEQAVLL